MSVLIKGMEMPKAGNWKTIRIYYDGTCAEPNWQGDCRYMQGCEAVPVPPHGRLIDADALMDTLQELFDERCEDAKFSGNRSACVTWNDAIYHIKSAPTIIEAEEEQE